MQAASQLYDAVCRLHYDTGREFDLVRHAPSPSGISGLGVIADGIRLDSGLIVMGWHPPHESLVLWPSIEEVEAVHGHSGSTEVVWK